MKPRAHILRIIEEELPRTCWKCGSWLVLRGRGLYCERCRRHRVFIVGLSFQWQQRGVGQRDISYVDVRESGRQRRKVILRGL